MRFNNLDDWLSWQETLNPAEIELGLERVSDVLQQAGLSSTFDCPLITVAGTNGKGSVVAILEAIAVATGLNVCSYTSPHLFRYNERIKINGMPVDDDQLCEAFEHIDQARVTPAGHDLQLTYFEFGTLAAIYLFARQKPDLVIMEIGLGGRLDAVNIMDADVSVLTSVAIDHVDWLGDDREKIGFEKAGVFRRGQTVICGESNPPASVIKQSDQCQCEFIQFGQHYDVINHSNTNDMSNDSWKLKSLYGNIDGISRPSLSGDFQKSNAATAIVALQALWKSRLFFEDCDLTSLKGQVSKSVNRFEQAVDAGLKKIYLPGRFQKVNDEPLVYVDVAHNPQAAEALASQLSSTKDKDIIDKTKTWAISAMLSDKDVESVISKVINCVDYWCFAGLENTARGMSADTFVERLSLSPEILTGLIPEEVSSELASESGKNQCKMLSDLVMVTNTVEDACKLVLEKADKADRVIIFGSFYTVSEAMQFFNIK